MIARAAKGSGRKAGSAAKPRNGALDPESPPLTLEGCESMRRVAPAKMIRERLGLSREEFARASGIPLETLEAQERRTVKPSAVEASCLRAIERTPHAIRLAPA